MSDEMEPLERVRMNAKANSKGEYALDCTFEDTAVSVDVLGAASSVVVGLKALEAKMEAEGFTIAGPPRLTGK